MSGSPQEVQNMMRDSAGDQRFQDKGLLEDLSTIRSEKESTRNVPLVA
jgi:hypothetical protein